jgi:DNA (cytosine-5)-methyltransferase 1
MNYLSVCSGIEAATVAWHQMGWKPVGFSEIEKFPSEVLAHHYPNVPNLGDMTKYKDWNLNDTVGLLVGGTPCQSFSVAGLRKGLEDPRGNLALTYVGILDKFRPKWCIWENVPGVLSSNRGRDFGAFLGALVELGYGWSYRVLDAQYFGVAQRRRRVFVVCHLGDWKPAAKVLFESESLCRDITKSNKKKQEITSASISSITKSVGAIDLKDISKTLTASYGTGGPDLDIKPLVLEPKTICIGGQHPNAAIGEEVCPTLTNAMGAGGGHVPIIGNMAIRKLTEVECERLQGFPDNYTNIKENCPSGPRYKALGNSMAVPVMRWIGERINKYESGNL